MMTLVLSLVIGSVLFGVGVYGALSQTNLVMIMMGVELMLGAAMVTTVAFWRFLHLDNYQLQLYVLIVMTVMAVEAAVGFGLGTARFRAKGSVEMEEATDLKG